MCPELEVRKKTNEGQWPHDTCTATNRKWPSALQPLSSFSEQFIVARTFSHQPIKRVVQAGEHGEYHVAVFLFLGGGCDCESAA